MPRGNQLGIGVNGHPRPDVAPAFRLFVRRDIALFRPAKRPNLVALQAAASEVPHNLVLIGRARRADFRNEAQDGVEARAGQAGGGADAVRLAARAFPPLSPPRRPSDTAAGFLPVLAPNATTGASSPRGGSASATALRPALNPLSMPLAFSRFSISQPYFTAQLPASILSRLRFQFASVPGPAASDLTLLSSICPDRRPMFLVFDL